MPTRIFIIEDNAPNLELMQYLLTAHGYEVSSAGDAETGLERVRTDRPEVVICDIHLPGMNGTDLAQVMKSDPDLRALPLVAVSALAMVGDRERIMTSGFDGYIAKPIEPNLFVRQLESYLHSEMRSGIKPAVAAGTTDAHAVRQSDRYSATILVVDDSPANLELFRATLEPVGFTVVAADSGDRAGKLLADFVPDLIISDLHLVGEPDYEFLRQVKANPRLRQVPVILLSATTPTQRAAEAGRRHGAARFLFRPIEPAVLLAEVENCLKGAE